MTPKARGRMLIAIFAATALSAALTLAVLVTLWLAFLR